ncbi:hypothetical protein N9L68_04890 [bacterium]|nr:hypothetical protein [bacterium]
MTALISQARQTFLQSMTRLKFSGSVDDIHFDMRNYDRVAVLAQQELHGDNSFLTNPPMADTIRRALSDRHTRCQQMACSSCETKSRPRTSAPRRRRNATRHPVTERTGRPASRPLIMVPTGILGDDKTTTWPASKPRLKGYPVMTNLAAADPTSGRISDIDTSRRPASGDESVQITITSAPERRMPPATIDRTTGRFRRPPRDAPAAGTLENDVRLRLSQLRGLDVEATLADFRHLNRAFFTKLGVAPCDPTPDRSGGRRGPNPGRPRHGVSRVITLRGQ